jgi:hypothetical protein
VDSVIERLLEVRGSRPGKPVNLAEHEVKALCIKAREIFMSQPVLLELEAPIKICGASLPPCYCSMQCSYARIPGEGSRSPWRPFPAQSCDELSALKRRVGAAGVGAHERHESKPCAQ